MSDQDSRQYSAAYRIPLIKAPTLRIPKPIQLPPDIHPLPDDVAPYFAYPFTLEPHTLTLESSRQITLQSHQSRNSAFLRNREDEKTLRKREALRKIAPGFEPSSGPLVPTKVLVHSRQSSATTAGVGVDFFGDDRQKVTPHAPHSEDISEAKVRDVMDDLVDQLAAMDSEKPDGAR
ncbi:uncharacterized protein EI90DRAFT_3123128 [Cantharellus anzutake]|uniref:uncharacterized protein n=1 Tax=Cantharellus anzutake TaxID=1750568 RepID=UPI0019083D3A|nr:uncharacterized protein EI90DRAFT_3123128 [Cantharellus anzutake]KAF8332051.1 hypothetical protein EI90DRAFT_3123128 [Cantharellus anzutake]